MGLTEQTRQSDVPVGTFGEHHEVFARFTFNREWEVSELSFAKFIAQVTRPDSDIVGLPVVCSRLFRFSRLLRYTIWLR